MTTHEGRQAAEEIRGVLSLTKIVTLPGMDQRRVVGNELGKLLGAKQMDDGRAPALLREAMETTATELHKIATLLGTVATNCGNAHPHRGAKPPPAAAATFDAAKSLLGGLWQASKLQRPGPPMHLMERARPLFAKTGSSSGSSATRTRPRSGAFR
eukprot:g1160.t1